MNISRGRPGISPGLLIALVAVAALVVSGLAYYTSFAHANSSEQSTSATVASAAQPDTFRITLPGGVGRNQSLNFQPSVVVLVIGVNNTVTWINDDIAPHTVTSNAVPSGAATFNSGNMNSGAAFTYTFTIPGTYKYDCTYHFWMQATIVVSQAH